MVTADTAGFTSKQFEASLGVGGNRGLVATEEADKGRWSGNQRALERG